MSVTEAPAIPDEAHLRSMFITVNDAIEPVWKLAMSLEQTPPDRLSAEQAWHLYDYADTLRSEARDLARHARKIQELAATIYDEGRTLD